MNIHGLSSVLKKGKAGAESPERLHLLDALRGVTILSMIAYHGMWDLVFLAGVRADWYLGKGAFYWQQSICITFIFLSGFCVIFSRHLLKRGLQVLASAAVVSAVTYLVLPEEPILFGVLCLIGCCMILTYGLEKIRNSAGKKLPGETAISAAAGFLLCLMLFVVFKNINHGYVGIPGVFTADLPAGLYSGYFMTFLGFLDHRFVFSDYFSLIPWTFLFLSGVHFSAWMEKKGLLGAKSSTGKVLRVKLPVFSALGRHSLFIYLIHQPFLYLIAMLVMAARG